MYVILKQTCRPTNIVLTRVGLYTQTIPYAVWANIR